MFTTGFVFSSNFQQSVVPEDEKQHIKILRDLLMEADAVVCSRAIPKVKAKLVRMVRSYNKVVLAIGDGANDVNMLTVAMINSGSECGSRTVWRRRHAGSTVCRLCTGKLQVLMEAGPCPRTLAPHESYQIHQLFLLQEHHLYSPAIRFWFSQLFLRLTFV